MFFQSDDPEGVFADVGGALVRVAGAGNIVDGNPVRFTQFRGDTSVDGRTVVLFLSFEEFADGALYGASF